MERKELFDEGSVGDALDRALVVSLRGGGHAHPHSPGCGAESQFVAARLC